MTYLTIRVTDKANTLTEYTHVTSYDVRENCVFINIVMVMNMLSFIISIMMSIMVKVVGNIILTKKH